MTYGPGYPGASPWADPATQTQPGSPYLGPPPTAPQPYGPPPQYGYPAPYGHPGYGYPGPWGPVPPRRPQKPGQVITSAVLAFVQAGVVLIASLYLWFFASVIDVVAQDNPAVYGSSRVDALASEVTVLAVVQLATVVLLILAGVRALSARTRTAWLLTVGAHAVQIVLALYWAVRLVTLMNEAPGADTTGALAAVTIFFAASPVVGLGMVLGGAGRRWFESPQQP
ncbi:DUF3824 domain-containing protein [Blastococcus sp. CT_GayMR16]|uniref:DUF3824 domain-containing protein n=1 Tax=Blastococcus sp. CT_GayMR16 TaxID=2559607 RepID=UPI0010739256|nr:DUF3824 domain-containing protein [Blastococcus sp. CT_GayMR16]TFV87578.1 hypothetical protein E4P38_13095 [Blastococcus sp. CT_GayMR16]